MTKLEVAFPPKGELNVVRPPAFMYPGGVLQQFALFLYQPAYAGSES